MHAVPETRRRRDPLIGGLVLVIIGGLLLVGQFWPDVGRYTVLVIGLGVLAIFVVTRAYGALVGGSIVSGVGVGVILGTLYTGEMTGALVLVSLGGGFLLIWLISYLLNMPERHVWPLIPGTILVAIGTALAIGGRATELVSYWPVILIVIGVVVMGAAFLRRSSEA